MAREEVNVVRSGGWRASRSVVLTAIFAVVVTIGALTTVVLMRPGWGSGAAGDGGGDASVPQSGAGSGCGDNPCQVLTSTEVDGLPVELLADGNGRAGRLRIGGPASNTVVETVITGMGVKLNQDSLRCGGSRTRACLIRGNGDGGMVGEVLVARGDAWKPADRPYFSDASSIALTEVSGDDTPEVVVVRHDCGAGSSGEKCRNRPVVAEVFDVSGDQLGCTKKYTSPSQLRDWPEVRPKQSELSTCRG